MVTLLEQLCVDDPTWLEEKNKLVSASSLVSIVTIAWLIGLRLARTIVQQELGRRAKAPTQWPNCPHCKKRLHSKGFEERRILTLVGEVQWSRRVGRCPNSCPGSQKIPFDEQLEISSYQQTSTEVIRLGCLLAVFVPFEITAHLLENLTGIKVCPQTVWNWVL